MIVTKFGGTAITPRNLHRVKEIVESDENRKLVVVSAIGKTHETDVKTTDLLIDFFQSGKLDCWQKVCNKYEQLVFYNKIGFDVEKSLQEAFLRIQKARRVDDVASIGEELSAKIVAKYLNFDYVEAENVILFDEKLSILKTAKMLKSTIKNIKKGSVLGGFYGGSKTGRKLFERGGSDVSASLCATALNFDMVENFVDVSGFCVASPKQVFAPKTIRCISFDDATILTKFGATVLHPTCITLLKRKNIPLSVKSFYNPYDQGTIISNESAPKQLLGLSAKQIGNKVVAKVVFSYSPQDALNLLSKTNLPFDKIKLEKNCLTIETQEKCDVVANYLYNTFAVDTAS
ncbi:MAG: hypothetical protein J6R37_02530 [Clostridia bacterium]|nr:hypothetical protein [Clostridia bacterium]